MTEPSAVQPTPSAPAATDTAQHADATGAGALLRRAREAQGLQLDALAAAIKVSASKIDALESGRLSELPDLTFARALAQTICRALRTDPAPVLALMPGAAPSRLERVDEGLNTPMPERGHGLAFAVWTAGGEWAPWRRPVPWLAGLLLVAAAAFVLVPRRPVETMPLPATPPAAPAVPMSGGESTAVLPAGSASDAAAATAPLPDAGAAAPAQPVATAASAAVAAVPAVPQASAAVPASSPVVSADGLALRAQQDTWVQVSDGNGRVLLSRLVTAGEALAFDGPLPLKLRIGNVRGTELVFKGQPVDLGPYRRDNVATLTLR